MSSSSRTIRDLHIKMTTVFAVQVLFCGLLSAFAAEAASSVAQFTAIPVDFGPLSLTADGEVEWSVKAPYFDPTWIGDPVFDNEDWITAYMDGGDDTTELSPSLRLLPAAYIDYYDGGQWPIDDDDAFLRLSIDVCQDRLQIDVTLSVNETRQVGCNPCLPSVDIVTFQFIYTHVTWRASHEDSLVHWLPATGRLVSLLALSPSNPGLRMIDATRRQSRLDQLIHATFHADVLSSLTEPSPPAIGLATATSADNGRWLTDQWLTGDFDNQARDKASVRWNPTTDDITARASPVLSFLDTILVANLTQDAFHPHAETWPELDLLPMGGRPSGTVTCDQTVFPVSDSRLQAPDIPVSLSVGRTLPRDGSSVALGTNCHELGSNVTGSMVMSWTQCQTSVHLDVTMFTTTDCSGSVALVLELDLTDDNLVWSSPEDENLQQFTVQGSGELSWTRYQGGTGFINDGPTLGDEQSLTLSDPTDISITWDWSLPLTPTAQLNLANQGDASLIFINPNNPGQPEFWMWNGREFAWDESTSDLLINPSTWACPADPSADADRLQQVMAESTSSTSHPALLSILDFGVDVSGPFNLPRTFDTGLGSCASIRDSSEEGGPQAYPVGQFDRWLATRMKHGHWVTANHPGQALFPDLPINDGTPLSVDGGEADPLVNGLSQLPWNKDHSHVRTVTPHTDDGGRHFLIYTCRLPLSDLLTCLLSPTTDDSSAVQIESSPLHNQTVYTFFPVWMGLGPSSPLGARGTMRATGSQSVLTINQLAWVGQQSSSERSFRASVVQASGLSGPTFGCGGGEGRLHVELRLEHIHGQDDRDDLRIGVPLLSSVQPGTEFGPGQPYSNCFDFPALVGSDNEDLQSLDNWGLESLHRPWEAEVPGQRTGDQLACSGQADCNKHGAPHCQLGSRSCFQRLSLSSGCLDLSTHPSGDILYADDCPFSSDSLTTPIDQGGRFLIEFPVMTCSSEADWLSSVGSPTPTGSCTLSSTQQTLQLQLFDVDIHPSPTPVAGELGLISRLLPTPSSADLDVDGIDTTDLTNSDPLNWMLETPWVMDVSGHVTLAVHAWESTQSVLPLALRDVIVCRGTSASALAFLQGGPLAFEHALSTKVCLEQFYHLYRQTDTLFDRDCGPTSDQPCLAVGQRPKSLLSAADPSSFPNSEDVRSTFPVCGDHLGCDALSIAVSDLTHASRAGQPTDGQVLLILARVFVGPVQPSTWSTQSLAGRRLSSSSTEVDRAGSWVLTGQYVVGEPLNDASSSTGEGVVDVSSSSTGIMDDGLGGSTLVIQDDDDVDLPHELLVYVVSSLAILFGTMVTTLAIVKFIRWRQLKGRL